MGDSLITGWGCLVTDTLPYQLENLLNAAFWNHRFEVINGGVGKYSVHNSWHRYLHKFTKYSPDLVILSLCHNDAEMYEQCESLSDHELQMSGLEYHQHTFLDGSNHFLYVKCLLQDVAKYVAQGGPPVIITFYDIGSEHRSNSVPALRAACDAVSLPFIDLSEDFDTPSQAMNMIVSEADDHPSALAHSIAAQRLVRKLIDLNVLPTNTSDPQAEATLVENAIGSAVLSIRNGIDVGNTLHHTTRMLTAKKQSRARNRLIPALLLSEDAHQATLLDLNRVWDRYTTQLRLTAYAQQIRANVRHFDLEVQYCQWITARLSQTLAVAKERICNPEMPVIEPFTQVASFPHEREELTSEQVQTQFTDYLQLHQRVQSRLSASVNLESAVAGQLHVAVEQINGNIRSVVRQLSLHFNEAESLILEGLDHLKLWTELSDSIQPELLLPVAAPAKKSWPSRLFDRVSGTRSSPQEQTIPAASGSADVSLMLNRALSLFSDLNYSLGKLLLQIDYPRLEGVVSSTDKQIRESFLVYLQVECKAHGDILSHGGPTERNDAPFMLVRVEPSSGSIRESHEFNHIVADGKPRLYNFTLPHFVDAQMRVGIRGNDVQIERLVFSNRTDRVCCLSVLAGELAETAEDGMRWYSTHIVLPAIL